MVEEVEPQEGSERRNDSGVHRALLAASGGQPVMGAAGGVGWETRQTRLDKTRVGKGVEGLEGRMALF